MFSSVKLILTELSNIWKDNNFNNYTNANGLSQPWLLPPLIVLIHSSCLLLTQTFPQAQWVPTHPSMCDLLASNLAAALALLCTELSKSCWSCLYLALSR